MNFHQQCVVIKYFLVRTVTMINNHISVYNLFVDNQNRLFAKMNLILVATMELLISRMCL